MALNELYFVTSDLDTYFVDKDSGLPLAGGIISFYRDVARSTPKTVYTLTGAPPDYTYTALPNPIKLSSVGTVQDNSGNNVVIYYFPYDEDGNLDLYYVSVTNSGFVLQLTREAWPNVTAADNPSQNNFPIQNQIANPQFTQVFINEGQSTIYSVSAATNEVFAFAPNWDFVISGTGTVTIQQIPIAGNENVATSPPYVLDVSVSVGITSCSLRQRLYVNSGLWASTANESIFLAGAFVAINEAAGTTGLQMYYIASSGGSPILVVDGSFDNSGYQLITGTTADPLPLSSDTNSGNAGYVDIYLSFLIGSHIRLSSIQVLPTLNEAGPSVIQYDLNSSNREQALMGDYYIPRLNARPAKSLLTGWDFPVNPFQFAASGNLTTTAAYICDQTIGLAGSSGNVAFSQDAVTNGLALATAGTNDAFYILQYLSGADAKKILGAPLSVNVFGYVTSASGAVTMSVYLFRAPSTSTIPTLPTSIGTVATNGVFSLTASGWVAIPRSGLPTAQAVLPVITTDSQIDNLSNDMSFTGWEITDSTQISDTEYFAIVATFAYVDTDTDITINSISVIPSDIPSRPAPESLTESLTKCQYYYESSYDLGTYPGAITGGGAIVCYQFPVAATTHMPVYPRFLTARYSVEKRLSVTPSIFSPDSTAASVIIACYYAATVVGNADAAISGNWTLVDSGQTGFSFQPVDRSVTVADPSGSGITNPNFAEAVAAFHFVSDARLGIV